MNSNNKFVTIWVVEDNDEVRDKLVRLFNNTDDLRCTGAYWDGESILSALDKKSGSPPPDVVLLDIRLPGISGVDCIRKLKLALPDTYIVMLTNVDDSDTIYQAYWAGASGYLLKADDDLDLPKEIRIASQGRMLMPPEVAHRFAEYFKQSDAKLKYGVTKRELEVIALMADGFTEIEIGTRLFISEHTVNSHVQNIYRKLHASNRAGAVATALRERLIR